MTPPATLPADRQAFLAAVQASGLLTPGQFTKATAALPPDAATAAAAADFLSAVGFLTRFQADRLLAGRTDGFVLGQYAIQEQVGQGSMGRVYRAKHRAMNRAVAIKLLDAGLTRTAEARDGLRREVRAAAKLNHPNVVTAYDANEVGERFYLVLEFVDGPNLEALVRQRGPLPVGEACEMVRQVACGLQHAHEHGMVHRDIKPTNLLAAKPSRTMPGCVVKIADFGIARLAPGRNGLLGTPDYVAPEQAYDPRLADHRADLYSLGCVFYFLLTGLPPCAAATVQETVWRHQFGQPHPVVALRPDVPPAVAGIVHRLLAKDPNARFQSAAAVAARLDVLAGQAVAVEDPATFVSFELPATRPGPYSSAAGYLSGVHSAAACETSPWAQLTNDTSEAEAGTIPADLGITPIAIRTHPRTSTAARSNGLSSWTVAGLCGGAVMFLVVAGLILRAVAK